MLRLGRARRVELFAAATRRGARARGSRTLLDRLGPLSTPARGSRDLVPPALSAIGRRLLAAGLRSSCSRVARLVDGDLSKPGITTRGSPISMACDVVRVPVGHLQRAAAPSSRTLVAAAAHWTEPTSSQREKKADFRQAVARRRLRIGRGGGARGGRARCKFIASRQRNLACTAASSLHRMPGSYLAWLANAVAFVTARLAAGVLRAGRAGPPRPAQRACKKRRKALPAGADGLASEGKFSPRYEPSPRAILAGAGR